MFTGKTRRRIPDFSRGTPTPDHSQRSRIRYPQYFQPSRKCLLAHRQDARRSRSGPTRITESDLRREDLPEGEVRAGDVVVGGHEDHRGVSPLPPRISRRRRFRACSRTTPPRGYARGVLVGGRGSRGVPLSAMVWRKTRSQRVPTTLPRGCGRAPRRKAGRLRQTRRWIRPSRPEDVQFPRRRRTRPGTLPGSSPPPREHDDRVRRPRGGPGAAARGGAGRPEGRRGGRTARGPSRRSRPPRRRGAGKERGLSFSRRPWYKIMVSIYGGTHGQVLDLR